MLRAVWRYPAPAPNHTAVPRPAQPNPGGSWVCVRAHPTALRQSGLTAEIGPYRRTASGLGV